MLIQNNFVNISNYTNSHKHKSCVSYNSSLVNKKIFLARPSTELIKAYYSPLKTNFKGVKILKLNNDFKSYEPHLIKELDYFEKFGDNSTHLGTGIWAETYRLANIPFVLKKLLKQESDLPSAVRKVIQDKGKDLFDMEIDGMEKASKALPNTQKFVAKAISDDGVKYLISTMVHGESPEPEDMPWTRMHFKSLFKTMFQLDKEGIYHGDLNNGNIKMTENGDVNFLDYQWTTKVNHSDFFIEKDTQEFPRFRYIENDQMFQMSGLSSYLNKLDDDETKNVFKDYLIEKSEYHKNRKELLEELLPNWQWGSEKESIRKAIDFEHVQSQLFKNPTDDVLEVEAQKLDLKGAIMAGFTYTDKMIENNNLLAGPTAQLFSLHSAQKFKRDLTDKRFNPNTIIMDRYLKHQIEEADYWIEKQKGKVNNTFHFTKKDIQNNLSLIINRDTSLKDFGAAPILGSKINSSLKSKDKNKICIPHSSELKILSNLLERDDKAFFTIRHPQVRQAKELKENLKDAFDMSLVSWSKDRHLDFFTANLYGLFCAEAYKTKLASIYPSQLSSNDIQALYSERALAEKVSNSFLDLSNKSFDNNMALMGNEYGRNYPEYKGMNDFSIGVSYNDKAIAKIKLNEITGFFDSLKNESAEETNNRIEKITDRKYLNGLLPLLDSDKVHVYEQECRSFECDDTIYEYTAKAVLDKITEIGKAEDAVLLEPFKNTTKKICHGSTHYWGDYKDAEPKYSNFKDYILKAIEKLKEKN